MRKSYIGEFDLWKLIAAVVIVILHSSYLPVEAERTYFHGGSIMVELFFLISGFFLAKSALRGRELPKNGGRGVRPGNSSRRKSGASTHTCCSRWLWVWLQKLLFIIRIFCSSSKTECGR